MSPKKPTIVLIPGAWHPVRLYHPLTSRLVAAGYEVVRLDYPATAANPTTTDLTSDIALVQETLSKLADRGDEILLLAHSAGGVIACDSAQGFSKNDRERDGKAGGIVKMFFMTAFAASEGNSVFDLAPPSGWFRIEHEVCIVEPGDAIKTFYNNSQRELADESVKSLLTISKSLLATKISYAAWRHIPSAYLMCENDRAIPIQGQEFMTTQDGANFEIFRCDADHSPFLGLLDFTAECVRKAAGEAI